MKLNCWPGCVAIVRSTPETRSVGIADRFLTVTELNGTTPDGSPSWDYEGSRLTSRDGFFEVIVTGIADSLLRPIRPDETPEESAEAMKKLHHIHNEVPA